jgi:hypothetical protein
METALSLAARTSYLDAFYLLCCGYKKCDLSMRENVPVETYMEIASTREPETAGKSADISSIHISPQSSSGEGIGGRWFLSGISVERPRIFVCLCSDSAFHNESYSIVRINWHFITGKKFEEK